MWRTHLTDRVEASPVLSLDGCSLLVASYNHRLYCLSLAEGRVLWQFLSQGMIKCSPLVARQGVFLGSYDKRLYRLHHSGRKVWGVALTQGSILASPVLLPGEDGDINIWTFLISWFHKITS